MDNELEARLRRLEAGQEQQRGLLERQAERQDQAVGLLHELLRLMQAGQAEPEGPSLHELLAAIVARLEQDNAVSRQLLEAIERLGRDGG